MTLYEDPRQAARVARALRKQAARDPEAAVAFDVLQELLHGGAVALEPDRATRVMQEWRQGSLDLPPEAPRW